MNSSSTLIGIMTLAAIAPVVSNVARAEAPEEVAMESSSAPSTPTAEYDPAAEPSASRFRWGIAANGGPVVGAYSGGAGGLDGRVGVQLSSILGLYAQPTLMLGASASSDAAGGSASGLALYGMGAMADATLGNMFYVAGGPEVLRGGFASVSGTTSGTTSASATAGTFFSLAGRTGLAFGSMRAERRRAFTLGLDMHVLFANGATFMPMLALGYESF
jgi:hypothetical protein